MQTNNLVRLKGRICGDSKCAYRKEHSGILHHNRVSGCADPKDGDLINGVCTGHSVLYWDLKLTLSMGIRTIYSMRQHFASDVASKATAAKCIANDFLVAAGELHHIDAIYRTANGVPTMPQLPQSDKQRSDCALANKKHRLDSGMIDNASRKTSLGVWPRVDLNSLFQ